MALVALKKITGSGGRFHAALGCMIRVIETDADYLADVGDARAETRRAVNQRESFNIKRAQARQTRFGNGLACNVVNDALKASQRTIGINQAWLFMAGISISNKLHFALSS